MMLNININIIISQNSFFKQIFINFQSLNTPLKKTRYISFNTKNYFKTILSFIQLNLYNY